MGLYWDFIICECVAMPSWSGLKVSADVRQYLHDQSGIDRLEKVIPWEDDSGG